MLLCLGLLLNRSAFGPFVVDLLIAAGLVAAGIFALKEVGLTAKQTPGHDVFLWIVLGLDLLGFGLVYSLGNYPD